MNAPRREPGHEGALPAGRPPRCRHALLLQGPAGPFMRRLADELQSHGARVTKVNFHAGDVFFFPGQDTVPYRGDRAAWPAFIRTVIARSGCDAMFLFGDRRPLHEEAVRAAKEMGVRVWVFEEGYLRPQWVTIEAGGVNGQSPLPRDPEVFRRAPQTIPEAGGPAAHAFARSAWYSTLNALAFTHANGRFTKYEHHRNLNAWFHTASWVRGAARKQVFRVRERRTLARFTGPLAGRYVFVPLQVHCDFQLRYSPYEDVVEFARELVAAFAAHAPPGDHLLFKHHPMDRPFREYGGLFRGLAREHGLSGRLHYVHDLHLPTLLKHAAKTVTINSTVGLQSIHHRTAVHCTGTAIYDLPGLTHQGTLAAFLAERPAPPDEALYRAFRAWLLRHNQIHGNFYERIDPSAGPTGFRWPPLLE